jgi:hypothetical protein
MAAGPALHNLIGIAKPRKTVANHFPKEKQHDHDHDHDHGHDRDAP